MIKKAWYTHKFQHIIGMRPSVAWERWNIPHPIVLFRNGRRVAIYASSKADRIEGRLAVSVDRNGRISEVWHKE